MKHPHTKTYAYKAWNDNKSTEKYWVVIEPKVQTQAECQSNRQPGATGIIWNNFS